MNKKYNYSIIIFLIVVTFVSFGRILGNGFINYDEIFYIIDNDHIKSGINIESIKWALTTTYFTYWHPLTWLSHMLDWILFKDIAGGHHLVSLILHILSTLFLFFSLNRMTKNLWSSAFAAAFFALHPLRVESVAWAAERKDILSMFFGMASVYAYTYYTENHQFSRYFLCFILFSFSLMSKPLLVTLPFIFLLLDYWPLKRWHKGTSDSLRKHGNAPAKLLWEKVPFIFLSVISSIATILAQNKNFAVVSIENLSFTMRVTNAIISYVKYLGKTFWPMDLAVFYPYEHSFPLLQILASCFILIVITITVIFFIKKLPFLFAGWFLYLGTLIPVIGLVQAGAQAMADRHTYLPSIGIAIILAWGIPLLFPREHLRKLILFPAAITILASLSALTWQQCGYWENSIKIWNHALQVTENNYVAHNNLGIDLLAKGKIEEAINHYNDAVRIKPDYAETYYNRGTAYAQLLGRYHEAIDDFNKAIILKSDYTKAYYNRGIAYFSLGNNKTGCHDAQKACELGNCKALEWAKIKGYCR